MKNFKNRFGVRGSVPLIKAFKSEVEQLGWKYDDNFTNWEDLDNRAPNPLLYFCVDNHSSMKKNHFSLSSSNSNVLTLPQDWNKALELAAEVEEEVVKVPEYVKCIKSHNNQFTKDKIYETRDYFGSVKKDDNGDSNGITLEGYFIPSTKAEFDAQELEYKKQELLSEAKRRYPVGCKFEVVHRKGTIWQVTSHSTHDDTFVNNRGLHINLLGKCIKGEDDGCISASVYFNGAWAEIVKDEFKVGDVVIITKNTNSSNNKVGDIGIITEMEANKPQFRVQVKDRKTMGNWTLKEECRRATPEEVAKYNQSKEDTIKIAGYKAKVKDNKIAFGCKKFSREDLLAIEEVLEISERTNLDFTFRDDRTVSIEYDGEDYPISLEDIRKLIRKCPQF